MTDLGQEVCQKAFKSDVGVNYLHLFEMLLCFEQWTKKVEFWKIDDDEAPEKVMKSIRKLLRTVSRIAKQTEGYKWKITKFHE